jgi:hypothetical protein
MSRILASCALVALVLSGTVAFADTLMYATGGGTKGELEEVTLLVNGLSRICPRTDIAGVEIGKPDVVTLTSGNKLEGKIVAVRFKSSSGAAMIGRIRIKSLQLDATWQPKEKSEDEEAEEEAAEDDSDVPDEQKEALKLNRKLLSAAVDKADDLEDKEEDSVDAKYANDKERIVNEAKALLRRIDYKRRRRRERQRETTSDGTHTYVDNDGLEADYKALNKTKKKRTELLKKIRAEKEVVEKKADERKMRIKAVWSEFQRTIKTGQAPTEETMLAKYREALGVAAKDGKGK